MCLSHEKKTQDIGVRRVKGSVLMLPYGGGCNRKSVALLRYRAVTDNIAERREKTVQQPLRRVRVSFVPFHFKCKERRSNW